MQYINHWPDTTKLNIPKAVSQDLQRQLLEPFVDEVEAKQFWKETSSTLIILDCTDAIQELHRDLSWNQIDFTLMRPKHKVISRERK